jgi:hypothetical protein
MTQNTQNSKENSLPPVENHSLKMLLGHTQRSLSEIRSGVNENKITTYSYNEIKMKIFSLIEKGYVLYGDRRTRFSITDKGKAVVSAEKIIAHSSDNEIINAINSLKSKVSVPVKPVVRSLEDKVSTLKTVSGIAGMPSDISLLLEEISKDISV